MDLKLDQVIFWMEAGRVVVQVDYFDGLGRLRQEKFYPHQKRVSDALKQVAEQLSDKGVGGTGRVRERKGSSLTRRLELEREFLGALGNGSY